MPASCSVIVGGHLLSTEVTPVAGAWHIFANRILRNGPQNRRGRRREFSGSDITPNRMAVNASYPGQHRGVKAIMNWPYRHYTTNVRSNEDYAPASDAGPSLATEVNVEGSERSLIGILVEDPKSAAY